MDIEEESIGSKLDEIINLLKQINEKIDTINKNTNSCKMSCDNMDTHINFVHDTYADLKAPLDCISSKFNFVNPFRLTGT